MKRRRARGAKLGADDPKAAANAGDQSHARFIRLGAGLFKGLSCCCLPCAAALRSLRTSLVSFKPFLYQSPQKTLFGRSFIYYKNIHA